MYPPIFAVCSADSSVTALLGTNPVRLWPAADAEEKPNLQTPYATWQQFGGSPENYLNCPPDMDGFTVQVDVFADTITEARDVAEALRDAIQGHAHIVGWRGDSRDGRTRNYRYSFDVDWFVPR